jgi:ABC-type Co2+ transport system permease subunit
MSRSRSSVRAAAVAAVVAADVSYPWPSSVRPTGAEPLAVVSLKGLAKADIVTIETLSGALARDAPRIYTIGGELDDMADANTFWLSRFKNVHNVTLDTRFLHDVPGLLTEFAKAGSIAGFVTYSEATNSTNAAIIQCSATDADPITGGVAVAAASGSVSAKLLESLGVRQLGDQTGKTAGASFAEWAADGNLSSTLSVFQPDDGAKSQCMSGYAVFGRAPVVEYQGNTTTYPKGGEAEAVLARVAKDPNLAVSMGWGPEYQLVQVREGRHGRTHSTPPPTPPPSAH